MRKANCTSSDNRSMKVRYCFLGICGIIVTGWIFILLSSFHKHTHHKILTTDENRVGMFTPYDIIPGGGERYFLTAALGYQKMGYEVDILTFTTNRCKTLQQLKMTTDALRIPLDMEKVKLIVVTSKRYEVVLPPSITYSYNIFFAMGNERIPYNKGMGARFNIYMCQFPFDLKNSIPTGKKLNYHLDILSSYDKVLVNSVYTFDWYTKASSAFMKLLTEQARLFPSIDILYPPVHPIPPGHERAFMKPGRKVLNIAVVGRFFIGRQSKHHDIALHLLERLEGHTRRKLHLFLIGTIHPEVENYQYVEELKHNATVKDLPVTFLTNTSPENLTHALTSSTLLWHLTGIREDPTHGDPASLEHFGIAVVEAMSAGCIPIVLDRGGTIDIVKNRENGFIAGSEDDFYRYTVEVAGMTRGDIKTLRDNAKKRAKLFTEDIFMDRLRKLSFNGVHSSVYKDFVSDNLARIRRSSSGLIMEKKSSQTGLMVVSFVDATVEFSIRNVVYYLSKSKLKWGLQLYGHSSLLSQLKSVLGDIENIQYTELPNLIITKSDYDNLLKNPTFWSGLKTQKVLIFQPNTVMLSSKIDQFIQYDYIGSPSSLPIDPKANKANSFLSDNYFVGKGGFSLRKVSKMSQILNKFGDKAEDIPEDLFFSTYAKEMKFKLPSIEIAYGFCRSEPLPKEIFETSHKSFKSPKLESLALDDAWTYVDVGEGKRLLSNSVPSWFFALGF